MILTFLLFSSLVFVLSYIYTSRGNYNIDNVERCFSPVRDPLRNRYLKRKVPNNIDYIIIGSGLGGLIPAAILSKMGKKILVLEKHYVAGGCTHTFEEKNYKFDTGLHYVGNPKDLDILFGKINENSKINWNKMGSKDYWCFDKLIIKNKTYYPPSGWNQYKDWLIYRFPDEKINILKYLELVKYLSKNNLYFKLKILEPKWLGRLLQKILCKKFIQYSQKTAYETINSIIKNNELQQILLSQCGDYGFPDESSFLMHAGVVSHYMDGGYYPSGGSNKITELLVETIMENNSKVLVNKKVSDILVESNKAVGVKMENDDIILANNVISAVGVKNTSLLIKNYKSEIHKFATLNNSISYFTVFLGLKGNKYDIKNLPNYNTWIWPKDILESLDSFNENPLNEEPHVFISFPSSKEKNEIDETNEIDENVNDNQSKGTAELICVLSEEIFLKWKNEKCNNRGDEYNLTKNIIADKMIKTAIEKYPILENMIDYKSIGTPLTNNYYLNSINGECLGLDSSPNRFLKHHITPKTDINNLFLSGQDVSTAGIAGAISGGILCSYAVLKYGQIHNLLMKRDLLTELK